MTDVRGRWPPYSWPRPTSWSCSTHSGEFLDGWSYESWATSKARETLGLELETGSRGVNYFDGKGMEALGRVEAGDLRELVANLMTHHLRQAGEIDAVSVSEETATVMNG